MIIECTEGEAPRYYWEKKGFNWTKGEEIKPPFEVFLKVELPLPIEIFETNYNHFELSGDIASYEIKEIDGKKVKIITGLNLTGVQFVKGK